MTMIGYPEKELKSSEDARMLTELGIGAGAQSRHRGAYGNLGSPASPWHLTVGTVGGRKQGFMPVAEEPQYLEVSTGVCKETK